MSNEVVILDFVMAEPAGVPFFASHTLEFDVSFVVLTAQNNFLKLLGVHVFFFVI